MDDQEPSLPKLLPYSHRESLPLNLRKRTRLSSPSISQSSDPPIFSSDDDPSADNYTNVRRKKIFRGPWYNQQLVDGKDKPKRTLQRQLDSGIWMGSDETDVDDVETNVKQPTRSNLGRLARIQPKRLTEGPSPEELAEREIERCLDDGCESINLISCNLKTLSDKAIKLLSTFAYAHSTPGSFRPLDPKMKLLLSANDIVRVPGEIFNIKHLHMLTLRANEIRELSPTISLLRNLDELNIANNSLRFLPFEILELLKEDSSLREFHFHPNPFYEPDLPAVSNEEESARPTTPKLLDPATETTSQGNWRTIYCFSSPVRYFYANGKLAKGPDMFEDNCKTEQRSSSPIPSSKNNLISEEPESRNSIRKIPVSKLGDIQSPPETTISAAPSLLELCLQTCYDSPELPHLADLEYPGMPGYFPSMFRNAQILKEDGGHNCTSCGRKFVITRVEWIEWWEIHKPVNRKVNTASAASPLRGWENSSGRDRIEAMVPLMRRGCSWKCYRPTASTI